MNFRRILVRENKGALRVIEDAQFVTFSDLCHVVFNVFVVSLRFWCSLFVLLSHYLHTAVMIFLLLSYHFYISSVSCLFYFRFGIRGG